MTDKLQEQITALETQVWQALVTGDKDADARHLSEGFLGVYPDGFAAKADHTGQLEGGPTVTTYTLDNHHLRVLGADHALLSYRARFQRCGRDTSEVMYVSSIWERRGAGWINIFSQDTPAQS